MLNKKGIGAIVASALILVVTVLAIVVFQNWFSTYSSDVFVNVELGSSELSSEKIEGLLDNTLYFSSNGNTNISEVKVGGYSCGVSSSNLQEGLNEISLSNCTQYLTTGENSVVVITSSSVIEKKIIIDKSSFVPLPVIEITFNSTNVVYGELFNVSWTTINSTSCSASGDWSGSLALNGSMNFTKIYDSKSYTITCTNSYGSSESTVNVLFTKYSDATAVDIFKSPYRNTDSLNDYITKFQFDSNNYIYGVGWFQGDLFDIGGGKTVTSPQNSYNIFYFKINESFEPIFLGGTDNPIGYATYETAPVGLEIDSSGNMYFAINSRKDYLYFVEGLNITNNNLTTQNSYIIKINSTGNISYVKQFGGDNVDTVNSLDIDSSGNVYVTGFSNSAVFDLGNGINFNNGGNYDAFIAKFDTSGNPLWVRNISSSSLDRFSNVDYDSVEDAVYVSGTFPITSSNGLSIGNGTRVDISNTGNFVLLVKYDSDGNVIFAKTERKTGPGLGANFNNLYVDDNGNIYLLSSISGNVTFDSNLIPAQSTSYVILKLNSTGNYSWHNVFNRTGGPFLNPGVISFEVFNNTLYNTLTYPGSTNWSIGSNFQILNIDLNRPFTYRYNITDGSIIDLYLNGSDITTSTSMSFNDARHDNMNFYYLAGGLSFDIEFATNVMLNDTFLRDYFLVRYFD